MFDISNFFRNKRSFLKLLFMGICLLSYPKKAEAYTEPTTIDLGIFTFLVGTPTPYGLTVFEHTLFLNSHKFTNNHGRTLGNVDSPDFDPRISILEFWYQTDWTVPTGAQIVLDAALAFSYQPNFETPNDLAFTSSGSGFLDPFAGIALQWQPTKICGYSFCHRVEIFSILPIGKFDKNHDINPGAHYLAFVAYWAGTFFINDKWEISTKLNYITSLKNHKTGIKPGDAFFMNYSTSWEINDKPNCRLGFGGYYLNQFQNSKQDGDTIKGSKELVLSIGPIFQVTFSDMTTCRLSAYSEVKNKNTVSFDRFILSIFHNFGKFGRSNCQ